MKMLKMLLDVTESGASVADKPLDINFSGETFVESLKYMGIGMVCIFVVVGVIALGVGILNKVTTKKKTAPSDEENDVEAE